MKFLVSLAMTKWADRARINGFPHTPAKLPVTQMVLEEKDLSGIRADPNTCKETIALIANGSAEIKPTISHVFPPEGLEKTSIIFNERLEKTVKIIVTPSSAGDSENPPPLGKGGDWIRSYDLRYIFLGGAKTTAIL